MARHRTHCHPLVRQMIAAGTCAVVLAACGPAAPPPALGNAPTAPSAASPSAADVGGLGTLRLPRKERSPRVQRLDDGTPVWVVNLGDGDVSVLATTVLDETAEPQPGDIRGLRTAVLWAINEQRFLGGVRLDDGGQWDIQGRAIAPDGSPLPAGRLDRYRATIRADRTVVVHAPLPGEPRAVQSSTRVPMPELHEAARVRFITDALGAPLAVEEALAQPEGTVVLVDADVVRNGTAPLAVCATDRSAPSSHEIARCPDGAPRPSDLTVPVPDPQSWEIRPGPLLTRVAGGTFTEVAQAGGAGGAGGAGSDESLRVTEDARVRVADGSVAVIEGWQVVEVRGSDVCAVLSQPRTLYVVRGRVRPCDRPLPPDLPGAVVRAVEDDPDTAARLRDGMPLPLYGTPGRARDDATAWLHPDVFTYDYVTDLRMLVSIADDPLPPIDEHYPHIGTEAVLRSLRRE